MPVNDVVAGEPGWLTWARSYVGVEEIRGPRHSPVIAGWLHRLRAWWADDETPWCGVFVAGVLDEVGIPIASGWARARAWLEWGTPIPLPLLGCVVVFERGPRFGHVGFVVGSSPTGALLVLGGNQGDRVSIVAFPRNRVIGYRWPPAQPLPGFRAELPVDSAPPTTGEA